MSDKKSKADLSSGRNAAAGPAEATMGVGLDAGASRICVPKLRLRDEAIVIGFCVDAVTVGGPCLTAQRLRRTHPMPDNSCRPERGRLKCAVAAQTGIVSNQCAIR